MSFSWATDTPVLDCQNFVLQCDILQKILAPHNSLDLQNEFFLVQIFKDHTKAKSESNSLQYVGICAVDSKVMMWLIKVGKGKNST